MSLISLIIFITESHRISFISISDHDLLTPPWPGHVKAFIWPKTRAVAFKIWTIALTIWTWTWELVQGDGEDARDTVQEAYEDTVTEDDTDAKANFLQACSDGDKDRMKQIIARRVDVNTAEEGSGNTGGNLNIAFNSLNKSWPFCGIFWTI